jgi:hypothetical protein
VFPDRRTYGLLSQVTAAECRQLAKQYGDQARAAGLSEKKATILKNLSRSFSGLASQLEILAAENERSP